MTSAPARRRGRRRRDQASDDAPGALAELYSPDIRVWAGGPDGGGSARNHGLLGVIEFALSPVITETLHGTITMWNPAAERMYGFTAAEVIGGNINIVIPQDRREEYWQAVEKIRADQPVDDFETVRVAKDGRMIDVMLSVSALKSPAGEVIGVVNIAHDNTEHKAAEEKFRIAVEACPDGMLMVDAAGTIVMVNGEIERLSGYRRDELIGQPVEMLVPERLRREHVRYRDIFAQNPERRRLRTALTGLRKDGIQFPVEVALNQIRTRNGLMILGAVTDITERKRLDRLKDEFVSVVSHELRTPLTSIAGALGLLLGNAAGTLPEPAMRLLTIAQSNSQRLVRLINDILDLQKIEAGEVVFRLEYLDLRPLIEQTIDANRAFAEGFGVRLSLAADSVAGEVLADPDRLAQVVTNLLSNAVKFSPPGDEVVVAIERHGDTVRVSVRDHGPGIPEEFKPRIFQKFAQADSSDARQKGGTGLGLNIVQQLLHQHGGKVGFETAPGGGTIFYCDLPRAPAPAEIDRLARAGAEGISVLLSDEDTVVSATLAALLRRAGFAVETVSTAARACAQAASTPYAALLIGLQFPDLDGIRLIRRLRALPHHADTPILVISVDPTRRRGEPRSAALPVCDWLDKPSDHSHLLHAFRRAIARLDAVRPRVLHVEPDEDLRNLVRETLRAHAEVISAGSADHARKVLTTFDHLDLAALDLTSMNDTDLNLLTELRNRDGQAIPVLLFSTDGPAFAERVNTVLARAHMSIERVVGAVQFAVLTHRHKAPGKTEVA